MERIIGVEVSRYDGAFGIVRKVEQALMALTEREVTYASNGERGPVIFLVQALPYFVGITGDPWSKFFPTREQAIELCEAHAPVQIETR